MLDELKPQVEVLMSGSPKPKMEHWINHSDHGDDESNYCGVCAEEVLTEMVLIGPYGVDFPGWDNCTPDTLSVYSSFDSNEDDGSRACERCGAMLDVSLTLYGVESELGHFEHHGIDTPQEWREVYAIIEGIDFVEKSWFPGDWMRESEVAKARNLYERTVALITKSIQQRNT